MDHDVGAPAAASGVTALAPPSGVKPQEGLEQSRSSTGAGSVPVALDDEYRRTVCKIGQGSACCRYLTCGGKGFECAKRTSLRFAIDSRVGSMNAKGDNCDGIYEPRPAFLLLRDRFGHPAGTLIYRAAGYDYGCASDDERMTGKPHTSMTLEPSGDYPFFTVPDEDFEPASVDTHPQGEDPLVASAPLSGAVLPEEAADAQNSSKRTTSHA